MENAKTGTNGTYRIWRLKVAKTTNKRIIKLTVDIRRGPVTPAQKTAWRKFWARLISEAKRER